MQQISPGGDRGALSGVGSPARAGARRRGRALRRAALFVAVAMASRASAQITLPVDCVADNTIYSDVVTFSNGAGESATCAGDCQGCHELSELS